jgi:hypothetical protein
LKPISRSAVLPNCVTNCFQWIGLQARLTKQANEITGEQIAAAALCKVRISRCIHIHLAMASAHQRLMAFQNHRRIAVALRKLA